MSGNFSIARILGDGPTGSSEKGECSSESCEKSAEFFNDAEDRGDDIPGAVSSSTHLPHLHPPLPGVLMAPSCSSAVQEVDLQDMFNPNLWTYYTQNFINKQIFGLNGEKL